MDLGSGTDGIKWTTGVHMFPKKTLQTCDIGQFVFDDSELMKAPAKEISTDHA